MSKQVLAYLIVALGCSVAGCAPEVGSARWCDMMRDTPRGDWSANDALDFARHCVFDGDD